MTDQAIQSLGSFAKGEVPEPLQVTIKDGDGNVIALTGFTVKVAFDVIEGGNSTLGSGTPSLFDGPNGIVQYTWHANDFSEVGLFRLQFWVSDGTNTIASEIFQYSVEAATVAPSFP